MPLAMRLRMRSNTWLNTVFNRKGDQLMAIRIKARQNESAGQMLRRFKKLCEKENLIKDVKKRQYFEKPSERKRRARRKAESRRYRELNFPQQKSRS
jgi:small subunit ribosomal protein S21